MADRKTVLWSRDRLGLSMIAASLLVIVLSMILIAEHGRQTHVERIRAQGLSQVRILSSMSLSELVPVSNPAAIINTLKMTESNGNFAYATVVSSADVTLAEVTADGVIVPKLMPPRQPANWLGERVAGDDSSARPMIEYHAPILVNGELAAFIRLGFFQPGRGFSTDQLPFFATLALLVFLLTPLFYFLVRREIRPLDQISSNLSEFMESGSLGKVEIAASGELGEFMARFSQFLSKAENRFRELQADRERVVASTKLLSYRKERMLRVLESIPDAILVLDDNGQITLANNKLQDILGVNPETITGSDSLDWCTQQEVREFIAACQETSGHRAVTEPFEFVPCLAAQKTMEISAYPLFIPDGSRTIGSLIVIRDVTAEALARNSRGDFVAHVAHEFKTPLHVLSMYSEALQGAEPDDEELRVEATNVIHDEVTRLSQLINNMLSITKIEMGSLGITRQRVKVPELLDDVVASARHMRGAEALSIETNWSAEMTDQYLDKDMLRIALNNLLSNAVKYNNAGGRIQISAEETEEVVRIRVADNGIGISDTDLPKVFKKFYRSSEEEVANRSGHGLGLSLTKEIIELHNGTIAVESSPGKGTEFVIELWKFDAKMEKAI